jgi:hypothetical protein
MDGIFALWCSKSDKIDKWVKKIMSYSRIRKKLEEEQAGKEHR